MWFKLDTITVGFLLLSSYTPISAHPQPITDIQLVAESAINERADFADTSDLWKRKGGGGKGGKGGSSSSSSSSSSSGYVPSGSDALVNMEWERREKILSQVGAEAWKTMCLNGRENEVRLRSSGSSSSSSSGKGSTSSNTGGATRQGSGVQPSYGGGRYYGGGATSPYRSGLASPLGLSAVFLGAGALAVYPGFWLYGAYGYNYHNPYAFRNHSATNSTDNDNKSTRDIWINALVERQDTGVNQTKPVTCLCAAYSECGCDDNGNTTFLDALIGDGSYANLNKSVVNVADINGTSTIVLNGTLPNGTTTSGGTDNASGAELVQASGWLVMVALIGCTVFLV
ncbi:hypothetical protein D0Z07_0918 [Hyphodiscus hymeniophilus]|uniref:DUF7732 domain-containing protein n=1 Tax=Hyphodiscus hymeniophilus TaxID=353542 RepID=A0A9P7B0M6_9HELO|nr:hypothetical protein D0Z07_0918 [Hyphodiscus hymeniophilus]